MRRNKVNPTFDDFIMVSRKQVELAIFIRQYRRIHRISQKQMANICSIYGRQKNITFTTTDICSYENYKHIPTPPKFEILMNTMDLEPSMLK